MIFFNRTSAIIDKTLKDLSRLSYWCSVVVQLIFLGLYGFKIFVNRERLVYLIIYGILAVLSLGGFLFFLLTYKDKKEKSIIVTKRSIRFAKYAANAAMVVVILVQFVQTDVSDFDVVISGVSIASFAVEVFIEIIRLLYERYLDLFRIALEKDVDSLEDVIHPLRAIDRPFAALSEKLNPSEPPVLSEKERYVEELKEEFVTKQKAKKAERKSSEKNQLKEDLHSIKSAFAAKIHFRKKKAVNPEPPIKPKE